MKIEVSPITFELEVKRFYMPGFTLEGKCPECGEEYVHDFGTDYLSYPKVGEAFDHDCYCVECDHEWTIVLKLNIGLEVVP